MPHAPQHQQQQMCSSNANKCHTTQCFRMGSHKHKSPAAAAAASSASTPATVEPSAAAATWLGQLPMHCLLLLLLLCLLCQRTVAVGYSYARFEGPVVGPEHQIHVADVYGGGIRTDYVARPEYSFAYGVEDGKTRVLQNRKETRDGDTVRGVYSVVDPDGTLRVVKYTADDANGFQAEVITNGIATLHGHGSGTQHDNSLQHVPPSSVKDGDRYEGNDDETRGNNNNDAAKGHYEVHEKHNDDDDGEEQEEDDGEGHESKSAEGEAATDYDYDEDDEESYAGSSEEGYEEAHSNEVESNEN